MEHFTSEIIADLLSKSLETVSIGSEGFYDTGKEPGSAEGHYIDWLTIKNQTQSVADDVQRIRNHPLVPKNIPIYGYIY